MHLTNSWSIICKATSSYVNIIHLKDQDIKTNRIINIVGSNESYSDIICQIQERGRNDKKGPIYAGLTPKLLQQYQL